MSNEEKAIGARLLQFRRDRKVPRAPFARDCCLDPFNLGVWERGEVPLRWGAFLAISRQYGIHPTWLFCGEGARIFPLLWPTPAPFQQVRDKCFSEVYPVFADYFAEVEREMEPGHQETIEAFLYASRAGEAPGIAAIVAEAVRAHYRQPQQAVKIGPRTSLIPIPSPASAEAHSVIPHRPALI
jgi:hypothetical protein